MKAQISPVFFLVCYSSMAKTASGARHLTTSTSHSIESCFFLQQDGEKVENYEIYEIYEG
jgi:hypothetical protein